MQIEYHRGLSYGRKKNFYNELRGLDTELNSLWSLSKRATMSRQIETSLRYSAILKSLNKIVGEESFDNLMIGSIPWKGRRDFTKRVSTAISDVRSRVHRDVGDLKSLYSSDLKVDFSIIDSQVKMDPFRQFRE